jgi:D-inositol-3-phosphate glycosyltransferase
VNKRIGVLMYQTSASKGQELVAQRMVRDFNALGHKAFLITSVYHDGVEVIQPESLGEGKGYTLVEDPELGIPIIRVDSSVVKWPRRRVYFRDFVQVLGRIVDEFKLNVLITHSTLWNGPEEVGKFVSWRRYMRDLGGYRDALVFCHMSHFQEPSPKLYSMLERTFRMAWNRFSLSQILEVANLVLVVTPLEKDAKVKIGAAPKKCLLFPSGVDEELFMRYATADAKQFLRKHHLPEDAKLVSYLGTLEERKNPLGVVKVAEALKERDDVHFVIAGRGEGRYAARVRHESRRLPNVTYLGELDDREKILLIRSSYVNIILSRLEALGLTQIEFMYQGVPVVTSAVGGQSWLVRNGKEGIHVGGPEDTKGAAKAVAQLVDNCDLWSRLSANAKVRARNMTCSGMIRRLDDAITEEMVKENGLVNVPPEARETLIEPEMVLKTWSAGSWGVVATDKRLFARQGRFSRKVTEIPYVNIAYIEHVRRYPWKVLLAGLLPALVFSLSPVWHAILKSSLVSALEGLLSSVAAFVPQLAGPQNLLILLAAISIVTALAVFAFESRTGFNLCGSGMKPLYLPHVLGGVVTFIREIQDEHNMSSTGFLEAQKEEIEFAA